MCRSEYSSGEDGNMLCGTNMTDIKIANRSAILRLLHESGGMSRKQIAARLKLTPATITVIINELMSEGILEEGISIPNAGSAGRREVLVEISRSKHVALGLALGVGQAKFAAVNLHGEKIYEETICLPQDLTLQYVVEEVAGRIRAVIEHQSYSEEYIIGLGITVCGVVDCANGIILDSGGLWDDKNVPIVDKLRDVFSFPVIAANSVRSFANAYIFLQRDQKAQNMLFIRNEATMGVTLFLDGQFYGGNREVFDGIAHYTVIPDGRLCSCGKRGCLSTVATQDGMMESLRERFGKESTPLLYRQTEGVFSRLTFPMFVDAACNGDKGALEILENAQEAFANAVTFSIRLLSVQEVVFYGEMFEKEPFFLMLKEKLVKKTGASYKDNIYRAVPHSMQLEWNAAPIMAVTSFFGEGGHKDY